MPTLQNHLNHVSCPGLIISGTDTDVGKTYVTKIIAKQLLDNGINPGIYKPACSGSVVEKDQEPVWQDVEVAWEATEKKYDRNRICPQCFHAPLAPPVAAKLENKTVDPGLIDSGFQWWQDKVDFLLVEGVGGILAPLTEEEDITHFALMTGNPILIVSRLGLGTINHTLMTGETAKAKGLKIAGIILNESEPVENDLSRQTNPEEIRKRTDIPLLGIINWQSNQFVSIGDEKPVKINWSQLASTGTK